MSPAMSCTFQSKFWADVCTYQAIFDRNDSRIFIVACPIAINLISDRHRQGGELKFKNTGHF